MRKHRAAKRTSGQGLKLARSDGRRMAEAAASNRIREIRPSGIIGGLWETQAKEELGTHSPWRKRRSWSLSS